MIEGVPKRFQETVLSVQRLRVGDKVVFAKEKASLSPGPRAKDVSPAAKGDEYSYIVEKYWLVKELMADDRVCLITRRGKEHVISMHDPRLRRANVWERLFLGGRFPKLDALAN
jgi:hypothetical protein